MEPGCEPATRGPALKRKRQQRRTGSVSRISRRSSAELWDRTNLKTVKIIKNQFSVIVGITLVLGLACVGTRAEDTNTTGGEVPSVVVPKPKVRPERPDRPDKPGKDKGVNAGELKEIVKDFQDQKKEFLRERKDEKREARERARGDATPNTSVLRQESKDSVKDAVRQARDQGRKLIEEAKEQAK